MMGFAHHLTSLHLHSVHCDWDPPPGPSSHRGWSPGVPSPSSVLFQNKKGTQWWRPSTVSVWLKWVGEATTRSTAGGGALVMRRREVRGKWKEIKSLQRLTKHPFTHITAMCWRLINPQFSNEASHNQFIILIKHQKAAVYQMTDLFKTHRTAFGTWTLFSSVDKQADGAVR